MRTNTRQEYETRIEAAVTLALNNLEHPPTPAELADAAGFSRFHFGRIFSSALGESLAEFTRRLLLERAASQLVEGTRSVGEIATDAGYSVEAFTRAFKHHFLVTPTEFRRKPSRTEIASPNGVHWNPTVPRPRPQLVFSKENFMELEKLNAGPFRLLSFRHVGPYHEIGPVFGRLHGWAIEHKVPFEAAIGVWHDDPESTPAHELRSDAAITLPAGFEPVLSDGGPTYSEIPARRYVRATHMGSYAGLGDAWARFLQAVAAGGIVTAPHPCFEIYVNDCTAVPESEVRTDLYLPIQE
jgi:AraC family transcriptional regulator